MISLEDQVASVSVTLGERVTVRVEESAADGLLWSSPKIEGDGLQLVRSTALGEDVNRVQYREFVFTTHKPGRYERLFGNSLLLKALTTIFGNSERLAAQCH